MVRLTGHARPDYKARVQVPYPLLCAILGVALGWWPMFFHGPIAAKFNLLYIRGATAVWAWYSARMLIGFLVGMDETKTIQELILRKKLQD